MSVRLEVALGAASISRLGDGLSSGVTSTSLTTVTGSAGAGVGSGVFSAGVTDSVAPEGESSFLVAPSARAATLAANSVAMPLVFAGGLESTGGGALTSGAGVELVELVSEAAGAGVEAATGVALVVLSILTSSPELGSIILIPFLSLLIVPVLGGGSCEVGWGWWGGGCCCCCGGGCCCCCCC